jgi:hypothetical protein
MAYKLTYKLNKDEINESILRMREHTSLRKEMEEVESFTAKDAIEMMNKGIKDREFMLNISIQKQYIEIISLIKKAANEGSDHIFIEMEIFDDVVSMLKDKGFVPDKLFSNSYNIYWTR